MSLRGLRYYQVASNRINLHKPTSRKITEVVSTKIAYQPTIQNCKKNVENSVLKYYTVTADTENFHGKEDGSYVNTKSVYHSHNNIAEIRR